MVPIITKNGTLEKLTAKGCLDEIRWFDNINRLISTNELPTINLTGKIKAICQNNQNCPSDTSYFEINKDFIGKVEKPDSNTTICIGSDYTVNIHQCGGKVYWNDGFQQGESRTITISKFGILNYSFRCLDEKGISKWIDVNIHVSKPTLQDLVVYPNPTFEWIKIKSSGCLNGMKCRIYNLIGQKIYDGWAESMDNILQVNVSNLPSNEYLIELQLEETNEKTIKRVVKLNKQ